MKALQFDATGDITAVALRELAQPHVPADHVLVAVHAAGINPSDIKNVLGRFPYTTVPRIPGRDFAGVVVQGPAEWQGKAVWGSGKGVGFTQDGAHAEYLAFPLAGLSLKPQALSFAQAASCGVPYLTAMEALERSSVTQNTRLLVIGAAGAVGSAAIALAAARGAQIVGAVRKTEQHAALQQQGITSVLIGDGAAFASDVQAHFPGGADVVFDTTGLQLSLAVSAITTYGTVAVIAAPAEGVVPFPLLDFYRRGGNMVGINSLLHDTPTCARMLDQLGQWFDSGTLPAPTQFQIVALQQGVQAYRDIAHGSTCKTVLHIKD